MLHKSLLYPFHKDAKGKTLTQARSISCPNISENPLSFALELCSCPKARSLFQQRCYFLDSWTWTFPAVFCPTVDNGGLTIEVKRTLPKSNKGLALTSTWWKGKVYFQVTKAWSTPTPTQCSNMREKLGKILEDTDPHHRKSVLTVTGEKILDPVTPTHPRFCLPPTCTFFIWTKLETHQLKFH